MLEIEESVCSGFYSELAMSVLEKEKDMSVDDKIRRIGKIGTEIYGTTLLPMVVMDTKTKHIRIVE